jgi:hypothetical protein
MAYAQCAVDVQTLGTRDGFPSGFVVAEPFNGLTHVWLCSRKNHQAQRRKWVVVDRKEGSEC